MKCWPIKPLAQVADVVRGVSFDKSQVSDEPSKNSVPILRAGNIQKSLLTDSDLVYVQANLVSSEQRMRRGDLAICMSSGSPAIVGKTAHLETDWNGSVGAFCAIVRFNEDVHHRFGSYWFRSPSFFQWRDSNAKGANIQNLRRSDLENLRIPVPPMADQERIVKLLDAADELRKLRSQADQRTATIIPALFHEMFGDPIENPKDYTVVRLEEVTTRITDGVHQKPHYVEAGIPFISVKNITTGTLLFEECKFISIEDHKKFTKRCKPECFDVLYTKVGATYGRPAVIETDEEFSIYVSVCLIKPKKSLLDSHFLATALSTPALKKQADRSIKGIGVPDLHLDQIQKFLIPLPPLPLQKEFAQRVAEVRELESTQAASRRRLEDLFQSLLHRAFNGEL